MRRQPDDVAYTFIDYEVDPAGFAESLTWSQVYQRARVVAEELSVCGSVGDRAVILAPQGLDYIVAFLGALQAGFIAVPLSVPQFGTHDERVSGVLRDCSPAVILTTSAVVDAVMPFAGAQPGGSVPSVVEVDALDFDSPRRLGVGGGRYPATAYLQYTSGSTRQPAGVVISHRNLVTNFEQVMSDFFEDYGRVPPPDTTVVSWLPFYHDMGLFMGVCGPILAGLHTMLMSPVAFLQKPARWMQLLASNSHAFTSGPNFAFELAVRRTSDDDMAGLDLGDVLVIGSGSERIHSATLRRFTERFARFNLPRRRCDPHMGSRKQRCTWRPGERVIDQKSSALNPRSCRPATRSGAEAEAVRNWLAMVCRGRRRCGSWIRRLGLRIRMAGSGRSGCWARMSRWVIGVIRSSRSERLVASWWIRRRVRRWGRGCARGIWVFFLRVSCSSSGGSRIC